MSVNKTTPPPSSTGQQHSDATASEMASDAKSAATSKASDLKSKAKSEASKLADQARSAADEKVEDAKDYATDNIERTAEQIRDAGRQFGDDSYQAQAADYLASNLSQAADMIRRQDLGSLADDLTSFARRNPAIVLGGAALLGFAAARMLKASERSTADVRFESPTAGVSNTPYDRPIDRGYRS